MTLPKSFEEEKELVDRLGRECRSLYEVTVKALLALGFEQDLMTHSLKRNTRTHDNFYKPVEISMAAIEEITKNEEPKKLLDIFKQYDLGNEARIIWRAYDAIPAFIKMLYQLS